MSDLLTIGMATRGEPDDVWFTLTALTANHPRCRYLVVDNTPTYCPRTEAITRASGGTYLHRPDLTGTSKPRDAVFRYAETPWAMCIDSHVVLETGAVQAALDYCAAHPDGADLVQGPMVHDDGHGLSTHWNRPDPPGLWGTWDLDARGANKGNPAFEVPMMGLGLWMMRRAAWPGFHPLNRGFGGEEGVLHETVRRQGGKCLCLPALRWRHKFRDVGGWNKNPAPPYPLRLEDHVWNLLVGHRALGLGAEPQIYEHFGKRLPQEAWEQLVAAARAAQPFDGPWPEPKRQKLLAVWYSDNSALPALLDRSAASIVQARRFTQRHDVTVSACSWAPVPAFGGHGRAFTGTKRRGYDTIVAQIDQAVQAAIVKGETYDAVCFMEHDVLYPANYFDRIGDALAATPAAPVVSNLDYIGLNGTGWQHVRERHEPLHQLTLRWDTFAANLARAKGEARAGRPVVLEPNHGADRKEWVRLFPRVDVQMPAVHVNHAAGRLSSHGEVCYEPVGYTLDHPYWGEAKHAWPHEMTTVANLPATFKAPAGGCSVCEANKHATLASWYAAAAAQPSDFHEHVATLKDLAASCTHVTELSCWLKPADVALALGVGESGTFVSVCRGAKPQWGKLTAQMGERFVPHVAEPNAFAVEPTDLLFVDTEHTADALMPILERNHSRVRKYLIVHCTDTFGEVGDQSDRPGVMHALRTFCLKHPEWVVKRHDRANHGLMVLSRCPEDVKELPSLWRKAMNYAAAMKRHVANGMKTVPLEVLEERQGHCATCEERALDACAACGCPLEAKLVLASEECGLVKKGLPPKWEAVAAQ